MFAALALVAELGAGAATFAAALGWGLDVAAFLRLFPAGLGEQISKAATAEENAAGANTAGEGSGGRLLSAACSPSPPSFSSPRSWAAPWSAPTCGRTTGCPARCLRRSGRSRRSSRASDPMRYTVTGVPPQLASTAFTPHLNRMRASGAQQYKYAVLGAPGTVGIPAPTTDTAPSGDLGDLQWTGTARSVDAPDVWYPNKYFQAYAIEGPGAGMPVRVYDPARPGPTTLLPVPAEDYRAQYQRDSARLSARWPSLGQRQIREVPRLLRWRGHRAR